MLTLISFSLLSYHPFRLQSLAQMILDLDLLLLSTELVPPNLFNPFKASNRLQDACLPFRFGSAVRQLGYFPRSELVQHQRKWPAVPVSGS